MYVVRERTDADLESAAAALVAVHEVDGYPVEGVDDPIAWLVSDHLLKAWVAEEDRRIVGHVSVSTPQPGDVAAQMWMTRGNPPPIVAGRLFVAPDARGNHIATELGKEILSYAGQTRRRLVLDVMTKDFAAIQLYDRMGWELLGTSMHQFNDTETPALCYVAPP